MMIFIILLILLFLPSTFALNNKNDLIVHLVPHTHDDAGWQISVDEYQLSIVDTILDNVITTLQENPNRRFTYAETNFFASWFRRRSLTIQNKVKEFVNQGRLEIVNGGWVQHDEACTLYGDMIDQTTRGHLYLLLNLGVKPKVAWQLDPFGHSGTQAWLLARGAGMGAVFWGRSDYQELKERYGESRLEYLWDPSTSHPGEWVFAAQLFGQGKYGGYYSWIQFEDTSARERNYVQDDPTMPDYNAHLWVDRVVEFANRQANATRSKHQLWALGNDFNYQTASRWFVNLDKLIEHVNRAGRGVRLQYSTPSMYLAAKHAAGLSWEVRHGDLFPLADGPHEYWTGYFTSRPAMKRQYRSAASLLATARQIETAEAWFLSPFHRFTSVENNNSSMMMMMMMNKKTFDDDDDDDVNDVKDVRRPTSPVGKGWTDDLEGALAIASHHDGITGTARQSVTNDYQWRLSLGAVRAEQASLIAIGRLAGMSHPERRALGTCNCNSGGPRDCLNITSCSITESRQTDFFVVLWNSLPWNATRVFELPIAVLDDDEDEWIVSRGGVEIQSQLLPLDERTKSLTDMHLNSFGMSVKEKATRLAQLRNQATHRLAFLVRAPPMGFATYVVGKRTDYVDYNYDDKTQKIATNRRRRRRMRTTEQGQNAKEKVVTVTSETSQYQLELDASTNAIVGLVNKASGIRTNWRVTWGWYKSSVGGCTREDKSTNEEVACSTQASGAYIFRPNVSDVETRWTLPKSTVIINGDVVTEVRQTMSDWVSHVIRLRGTHVEVEWTVGPIPIDDGVGKEVVVRYESDVQNNGIFFTDANARETVQRVRDHRLFPAYPKKYESGHEPAASNFYPVNSFIALNDGQVEMAVLSDVTQAGSSLLDGRLELMTHRRVLVDDFRGVEEPLNETMCGCGDIHAAPGTMGAHGRLGDGGCDCVGLVVRGKHLIVFDKMEEAHDMRRRLALSLSNPFTAWFYDAAPRVIQGSAPIRDSFSVLHNPGAVPPNVHILTLCANYAGLFTFNNKEERTDVLLRVSHLYEVNEHSVLSRPVILRLDDVFGPDFEYKEVGLSANQDVRSAREAGNLKFKAFSSSSSNQVLEEDDDWLFGLSQHRILLRPMQVRTFWMYRSHALRT